MMQTMKDKMSSMIHASGGEKGEKKPKDWSPGYPIQE
jgi:hypothetical protein